MSDTAAGAAATAAASTSEAGHEHGHDAHGGHGGIGHVVPVWLLSAVFLALVGFTVLTVMFSVINIGQYDLPVAMFIATAKATLVALFFMHLRWDRPFNGLVFLMSVVFLGLFLSFALMDTRQYASDITRRQADKAAAAAAAGGK